jgi:hypothetical protein
MGLGLDCFCFSLLLPLQSSFIPELIIIISQNNNKKISQKIFILFTRKYKFIKIKRYLFWMKIKKRKEKEWW